MTAARKPFRHAGEEARRADLIAATIDCVAEGGVPAATVRAIALRAGVTQGLIRHYFPSKDHLVEAAYAALMEGMTGTAEAALAEAPATPLPRLAAYVASAFAPEVLSERRLAAWAGFVGIVHIAPGMRAVHRQYYLRYRDRLQTLIAAAQAAAGRSPDAADLRAQAIAVNAVLDGLWLEGGLQGDAFAPGELAARGLAAAAAILDLPLTEGRTP
jgi:AcrR family transcriptional regulator